MVIAGSSFSKQTDSKSHAFANNWSSRRYKNHAGIDSLTPFSRIRAIRKCAQQIFLFLSCRVGRSDCVTVSARGREARCGTAARSPSVSEFHVRQGPCEFQRDLSGRSSHLHVLDARRKRIVLSNPCGRALLSWLWKKNWRGNRRAESRSEYFEIAPARLEPSPRPPKRDRFNGDRGVPE